MRSPGVGYRDGRHASGGR